MAHAFYPTQITGLNVLNCVSEAHAWRMFHDWYSVPLFLFGSAEMEYRGVRLRSRANHVNVLEPGEVHRTTSIEVPPSFAVVFVPAQLFEATACELGYSGTPHFSARGEYRDPRLSRAVRSFLEITENGFIDAESALSDLVGCLLDTLSERPQRRRLVPTRPAFEAVLEAARSGGACPTIRELASRARASERQLHRSFRQCHGVSPVELFQLARVSQAMRSIGEAPNLAELAATCGFADQSHMNRVFRRVMACSAGRYSRELRGCF